ncbi:minor tail protein [Mycobacterium phage MarkPhew]|uniref:Minor tail protein n=1 Tax=Mycobacterium phage MarkPhew TaxID=2725625 RepID=A0A6M3SX54_9CAUD|nr:minor tail protein [Mycobacterium phage MarkPhew]QJD50327.1 minor tail protein [Mycobacterium phage MarkPhew]
MPPVFDRNPLRVDRDPMRSIFAEPARLPKLDAGTIWAEWLKGLKELTGLDLSSPQALVLSLGDIIGGALDPQHIAEMIGQVLGYVGGPLSGLAQLAKWAGDQLFGIIDPGRLPLLPLGHVSQASPNLLPNGAFTDVVAIDDPAGKWTLDATVGRTAPGSALTLADGTIHELLSVDLIPVVAGTKLDVEGWVKRSNVVGTNGSIYLGLTAYSDTKGATQATAAPNRPTVALMSTVTGTDDWVKLSGTYTVPATGVASVRLRLAVTNGATAGSIWFDDLRLAKGANLLHIDFVDGLGDELAGAWAAIEGAVEQLGNFLGLDKWQEFLNAAAGGIGGTIHSIIDRIVHLGLDGSFDASQLINVRNIPTLPNLVMEGINGIANIGESIQNTIDYLWSAFTGQHGTSKSMAALAQAAQQTSLDITQAVRLAQAHTAILSERRNKPAYLGLADTVEASFPLSDIASGTTPPSITVSATVAPMGFIRAAEGSTKGFVQWIGNGVANITGFYVNVYRMNAAGDLTLLHTSPDLQSQLTATWAWQAYVFSGANQVVVEPGDVLAAEFVITGSGTHAIAGMAASWVPSHPTAAPKRLGAVRNPSGNRSPATVAAASVGYTGAGIPWLSFGISNVAADYEAPVTSEYDTAGTYTYQIPAWAVYLDLVAIGGGGGGGSSFAFTTGQGGGYGYWSGKTLQRGVDFPANATQLTVVVGNGGGITTAEGRNGDPSGVGWVDLNGTTQQLVGAGGAYGGQGPNHNPNNPNGNTAGRGSSNFQWRSKTYFGGTDATYAGGSFPGGGGSGAAPYLQGYGGGPGAVWVTARQSPDD